jgi:hypothetical protein
VDAGIQKLMKIVIHGPATLVVVFLALGTSAIVRGEPAKIGYCVADLIKMGDENGILREASQRPLTAREFGDLAMQLAETGRSETALIIANLGLGVAKDDREKAALMATISLTWASRGEYRNAAEAAQRGQELLPDNITLAGLRFAYFELAGDGMASLSAKNHLMRLDPTFARRPVFLAELIIMIETGYKIYTVTKDAWERLDPKVKEKVKGMVADMWSSVEKRWSS